MFLLQVFTSTSTIVFKTFACDNIVVEGESYLREDYRLSCKSTTHTYFMIYAGVMIVVSSKKSSLRCELYVPLEWSCEHQVLIVTQRAPFKRSSWCFVGSVFLRCNMKRFVFLLFCD